MAVKLELHAGQSDASRKPCENNWAVRDILDTDFS